MRPPNFHLAYIMAVRLSCIDAVPSATDAVLTSLPVTIGRGDEADICIRDTWASRVHCRLCVRDGELYLEDLGSCNGTLVNGVRVHDVSIQRGDQITVGITTFRVTYSRLPESQKSPKSSPMLAGS
jgi:pSer/pThr/pTyr-binding forkhead associated (FHA) protein